MQEQAIEVATEAMQKFNIEKDIAQYIKKEFDDKRGATWHCIVGRNFGSFVTHGMLRGYDVYAPAADSVAETKHFIYFYLGHCAILLFKTQ
ncbi:putative dynein light chain type protein [Lasiodiplodia theobromae]|nr:putative dynein light chain type protein [Lasiodiplodia theobromae]